MKILFNSIFILLLLFSCQDSTTVESRIASEKVKNNLVEQKIENEDAGCGTFETYVLYDDSLTIYNDQAGQTVFAYFAFEDDSTFDFGRFVEFENSISGWLQIKTINSDLDVGRFTGKWIKSESTEIGTTNYANNEIPLYTYPELNSEKAGTIDKESYLNVIDFCKGWVKVAYKGTSGWLEPRHICTSDVTTCN